MKLNSKRKFYDFYRDGVTYSMLDKWLSCPQQCKLQYVDGWTPKGNESDSIFFGNICHHVLQRAYSGIALPMPGEIKSHILEYEELVYNDFLSNEELYQREILFVKAEAVMMAYFQVYKNDFKHNWEIAETIFKIPYEFKDGKKTFLNGKLDGGFVREDTNDLWLMDHKTKSMINIDNLVTLLPADLQINIYLYCVYKLNKKAPKGFYYNIIRNPQNKPKQREHATLDDFANELYDTILSKPEYYFYRIKLPVTEKEIVSFAENQLFPLLKDVRRWYDSNYIWPAYINTHNLETKYGLAPMALALIEGDFSNYYQREEVFPELV